MKTSTKENIASIAVFVVIYTLITIELYLTKNSIIETGFAIFGAYIFSIILGPNLIKKKHE